MAVDLAGNLLRRQHEPIQVSGDGGAVGRGPKAQIAKHAQCMDVEADVRLCVAVQMTLQRGRQFESDHQVKAEQCVEVTLKNAGFFNIKSSGPCKLRIGFVVGNGGPPEQTCARKQAARFWKHQLHNQAGTPPGVACRDDFTEPVDVAGLLALETAASRPETQKVARERDSVGRSTP